MVAGRTVVPAPGTDPGAPRKGPVMHPYTSGSYADSRRLEAEQAAQRHRQARIARPARTDRRPAPLARAFRFAAQGPQRLATLLAGRPGHQRLGDGLLEAGADGAEGVGCLSQ